MSRRSAISAGGPPPRGTHTLSLYFSTHQYHPYPHPHLHPHLHRHRHLHIISSPVGFEVEVDIDVAVCGVLAADHADAYGDGEMCLVRFPRGVPLL